MVCIKVSKMNLNLIAIIELLERLFEQVNNVDIMIKVINDDNALKKILSMLCSFDENQKQAA